MAKPRTEFDIKSKSSSKICASTCPYCGVGCGVDIHVSENHAAIAKITKVVGSEDHPANHGRLCVKGSQLLETNDATGRLLTPMINGRYATWSQAVEKVASRFSRIIEEHGPDSVAFYVSGQLLTEDYYVANKLMKGFIGSANIDTNSRLCMSSAVAAYKRAFGADTVPCCYEDLELADVVLLVGSNAAWTHPVLFQRIERARQINTAMQVISIDPRKTASSAMADLHLPIKPGTDVALFNGLLNYLSKNNALDDAYIEQFTQGFEESLAASKDWSIKRVATYCDIDETDLMSFYRLFAQKEKVVSVYSMGVNQSSQGVDKANAIINCHLASGKIGKVGAGPFSMTGQPNAMGGREVGGLANMLAAHMDIDNPQHRERVRRFWKSPGIAHKPGFKAVDLFEQIDQGKVKAVWIMATNPVVSMPNRAKIERALKQCEFVVVSDCVAENDTLKYADVKLPATSWSEKNGTVTNSERRISRQRGVLPPLGEAKHDWQIICDVAKEMGFGQHFDYSGPAQIFSEHACLTQYENDGERLLDLSGLSRLSESEYDQLRPIQWPVNKHNPNGRKRLFNDAIFCTASRKANFISVQPQLPEQRVSLRYPFVLNSGRVRDQWHSMTRTGKASGLTQHTEQAYLHINPQDADELSIHPQDLVSLKAPHSEHGQVVLPVKLDDTLRRSELFVPMHWNEQWSSSTSIAKLYNDAHDPLSGQPELKHAAVSLQKIKFATQVKLFVSQPLAMESVKGHFVYWVKTLFKGGYCYQIASDLPIAQVDQVCQQLVSGHDTMMSYAQDESIVRVGVNNNSLSSVIITETVQSDIDQHWLQSLFNDASISYETLSALLRKPSAQADSQGRMICSCFSVSESTILEAVKSGTASVDELGRKLQCGTNCGSCKPELESLIEQVQQKTTTGEQIPVIELEAVS